MSLEKLQEAILEQAEQDASAIATQLQEEKSAEEARILARAQNVEQTIIDSAEREAQNLARRKRQQTELDGRSAVLNAKEDELQQTKQELFTKLANEDAKDLIKKLAKHVPDEKGTIVAGELHKAEVASVLDKKHTIAKEVIPGEGGFVFRGKDTEINLTLGHLVDTLFRKYRTRLASLLFG